MLVGIGRQGQGAPLPDVAPRGGMADWTCVQAAAALVTTAAPAEDEARHNFGWFSEFVDFGLCFSVPLSNYTLSVLRCSPAIIWI